MQEYTLGLSDYVIIAFSLRACQLQCARR